MKGGTGSADSCNFSAKSADPEFLKVKSESAKDLAEKGKKEIFNKIIHIKVYKVRALLDCDLVSSH